MRLTADDYRAALQALLPTGLVWPRDPDATWTALLAALADELARCHDAAERLVDDADPRTVDALLPDWETLCGLVPSPDAPAAARREAVLLVLALRGGQTPQYFIDLAAAAGFTVTVEEFDPFMAGSTAGSLLYGDAWQFAWRVTTLEAQVTAFTAGARAGEALTTLNLGDLPALIARRQPAHTHVLYAVA
ncbi:MAG TPA: putative phage tail protein [Thermodesulfobacteriota bacterium]